MFSRLGDLENFRGNDGKFHFKLCLPLIQTRSLTELPCYEFKQLSNPFYIRIITRLRTLRSVEAPEIMISFETES